MKRIREIEGVHIDKDHREVTVSMHEDVTLGSNVTGRLVANETAKCLEGDVFDEVLGRRLAEDRATLDLCDQELDAIAQLIGFYLDEIQQLREDEVEIRKSARKVKKHFYRLKSQVRSKK